MRALDTMITINAPIGEVWAALTDLGNYGRWNPFIVSATGVCSTGEGLEIKMFIPDKGFQYYQVRVTAVAEPTTFGWLGHFKIRGLIDGNHCFELAELPSGATRVRQYEEFRGLLVPFVWRSFILRHLLPNFERLNQNLAAWCEHRSLPVKMVA